MPVATTTDGTHLWYERAGAGPPVLFIGGTGGDLRRRPNVLDGPLPHAFDVVTYDQRGLGRSDRRDEALTMATYGDDAAAVLDAVGWSSASVIGVSFGGMVAQELTLRHPGRVDRLVLACTSSGGDGGASYPLHELADRPDDERLRTSIGLSDVRRNAAWQADHPDQVEALLTTMRADAAVGADEEGRQAGARRQLEARAGHDTWEHLPQVTVPVLVAAGRYDGIAPPANQESLAVRIPEARLEWFDGGHLFLLQDRTAWPRIAAFLNPANPLGAD